MTDDNAPVEEVREVLHSNDDLSVDSTPNTREEAVFDSDEEDTLFDAYQMLRWVGVPKDQLRAMGNAIELTTIYNRDDLERYYTTVVCDDE